MKYKTPLHILAAAAVVCFTFTGCGTLEKLTLKPNTQPVVTTIPAHMTNVQQTFQPPPQITVVTQVVAGVPTLVSATNQPPPFTVSLPVQVPERTITNSTAIYEVNPQLLAALTTGQKLNSLLNPTPSAPIINAAFGAVTGLLGVFAAWKSRKEKEAQAGLAQAAAELKTVVKVVELFPGGDRKVLKGMIQEHAILDGTQLGLDETVQSITTP